MQDVDEMESATIDTIKLTTLEYINQWSKTSKNSTHLPYLTLTYAQSIDGSITAKRGTPTPLSGKSSMKMTHMLRSIHAGILIGVETLLADNPSLTCRLVQGENPQPIIIDSKLRCPLDCKLFMSDACVKPIIVTISSNNTADKLDKKECLEQAGAKIIECSHIIEEKDGQHRVDLRDALRQLRQHGLESVMIEGGASILASCLSESTNSHLIDHVLVTVAPVFIGGLNCVQSKLCSQTNKFPRLTSIKYFQLEEDMIIQGLFL